ncbi:MAG: 50S ribosomal protein L6 [Nitrososphaerota archaeon]
MDVPAGVSLRMDGAVLSIKGPLGECQKDFTKIPVQLSLEGSKLKIRTLTTRRKDIAILYTARSIIKNMFIGVTKGFTYRLKIVFAHFPISVKVKGREVFIENFYGERSPRVAKIVGGCEVFVEGDDIVVRGVSKEDVGQTAANIEQATRIRKKDQRVFLDGIYIYQKAVSS